jgi:hypothetical protein
MIATSNQYYVRMKIGWRKPGVLRVLISPILLTQVTHKPRKPLEFS